MAHSRSDPESSHDHELVTEDELFQDDPSSLQVEIVRPGERLAGKYRVERVHGRGALGVTCIALHEQLEQRVALKLFLAQPRSQLEGCARFLQCARRAAQLRNDHVARVLDLGTLDSGTPYSVTEYLSGTDLRGVLRVRESLPVAEAVDYALQICEALAAAHVDGLVHRNLKPANVFLAREHDGRPSIKVLDFCLVEGLLSDTPILLSTTSSVVSSLAYLAPEQVRAPETVDARADIWALGAVLHEWLSGTPAFSAASVPGIFAAIAADPIPPLRELNPEVPSELEEVLLRCLEKERDYRWSDVGTLARQLRPFASEQGRAGVDRVLMVLERRIRNTRSIIPPSMPAVGARSPVAGAAAPAHSTNAAVVRQPAARRRTLEVGLAALAIVGGSVGVSAFVAIQHLRGVLAARASDRAVVASLSPALAAPQPDVKGVARSLDPVPTAAASSSVLSTQVAPVPAKIGNRPAPRPAAKPAAHDAVSPEPSVVAEHQAAPAAPHALFDEPN
ncbi:MAG: serine/threonine-protein kinase [Polyangiaceae bacterium]